VQILSTSLTERIYGDPLFLGVLFFICISSFSFYIIPTFSLFFLGDIHVVIGMIVFSAIIYHKKNLSDSIKPIIAGGIIGSFFVSILISIVVTFLVAIYDQKISTVDFFLMELRLTILLSLIVGFVFLTCIYITTRIKGRMIETESRIEG